MEDASKLLKIPNSECPDIWIRLPRHKWQFEKILLQHGWEKVSNWECLFLHLDGIKLAGKKQNIVPMWKVLNKEVDLGAPTSCLDHVYLRCSRRQREVKILWTITEPCLNHEFPRVEQKNYHSLKIFVSLHGLMTWPVMQRNVWNDIVSWRTRRLSNSSKYLLHALMTIMSRKNKWNLLEICHKYALKWF